jgi:hypothetical protein
MSAEWDFRWTNHGKSLLVRLVHYACLLFSISYLYVSNKLHESDKAKRPPGNRVVVTVDTVAIATRLFVSMCARHTKSDPHSLIATWPSKAAAPKTNQVTGHDTTEAAGATAEALRISIPLVEAKLSRLAQRTWRPASQYWMRRYPRTTAERL